MGIPRVKVSLFVLPLVTWVCAFAQTSQSTDAQAAQSSTSSSVSPTTQTSPGAQTAQAAAPASTPDPPPPTTFSNSAVRLDGIDFLGMVDGYYSFNNNHPVPSINQLYNFDDLTNQWDLNLLKLTVSHDPAPIGFRFDLGYGRAFEEMHYPNPDPDFFRYVEQAFISVKPKEWKGLEVDLGDFVTSAGAEVIESKDNWNYSRSLLFSLAIPYYHFGVRASMPIGSSLTVGVQVVNGWNTIVSTHGDNMQTVGIVGAYTRKKFTWSNNYYVGPQYTTTSNRNRALFDTTLLLTPNDRINAYINYDYGQQRRVLAPGVDWWTGIAGALHLQLNKYFAISPRFEYFNDATGFTTGTKQYLHEVTVTGEYKIMAGLLSRVEFRRDSSNVDYFNHGNEPSSSKSQTTVSLGLIAFFPSKH